MIAADYLKRIAAWSRELNDRETEVARVLGAIQPLEADVRPGSLVTTTYAEVEAEIGDLARAFVRMSQALKDVQGQLIQSEKMAAFGQLGAGITHEVKNPMTGIVSFAQLAQRKIDEKDKVMEFLKRDKYVEV